jgi:hypothetical protein
MKKLRTVLAGILLTLPLFALNASSVAIEGEGLEIQQPSVTGWCLVFFAGYWWVVPC